MIAGAVMGISGGTSTEGVTNWADGEGFEAGDTKSGAFGFSSSASCLSAGGCSGLFGTTAGITRTGGDSGDLVLEGDDIGSV